MLAAILLDLLYLAVLALLTPRLLYKALSAGKYRRGWRERLFGALPSASSIPDSAVWFHGVSVGEIHLLRTLTAAFRERHPDQSFLISTTTDTGYAEARRCFPGVCVVRWPLDFSWAVANALDVVQPRLIVLAECEYWPNFLRAAQRRRIPVVVINGRMSPRSFRRYASLRVLAKRWLQRIAHFGVQSEEYLDMLVRLGVPRERLSVTGSVKYDGVQTDRNNPKSAAMRDLLGVEPRDIVWVAGSTQSPEEEICLRVYQRLRRDFPHLRLILVPRQQDRFEEAAHLLTRAGEPFVRRRELSSNTTAGKLGGRQPPIILLDTIGELSAVWGLADIAFVGGSLDGRRGGQNMIEPAAYGAAVLFGPHVWNFRDTVRRLLDAGGAMEIVDESQLEATMRRLLMEGGERRRLGDNAQRLVLQQRGAAQRTLNVIDQYLHAPPASATCTA